ncbi:TolC family protein [Myxococcota bacterium]|nr:TolC family protein [Myxococcota bacterium]
MAAGPSLRFRPLRHGLAVLLGQDPTGALPPGASALPELPAAPAVGAPADLVEARPDVRAAMTRAESAGVRRSAALRGLLPTLALTGSAGWQATWIDDWNDQDTWTAGASLSVPLFNGGSTHAAIRAGSAARDAALLNLESTLRGAVQEVEAALVTEAAQQERRQAATRQRERAEAAWSVAHDGYGAGTVDYLQAQSALVTLLSARLTELSAHRDLLSARLQLHLALGGTWTRDLASRSSSAPSSSSANNAAGAR